MKTFAAVALLSWICSTSAHAETAWIGNAFVTTVTPGCGTTVAEGDFYTIIYRPAGVALGNNADSYLSMVGQRSYFSMLVPNNTFRSGINYGGQYVSSQVNFGSTVGGILAWSMSPATLGLGSKHADLNFAISKFFNLSGCNAGFHADLELAL
jgi:hypothetical protein